MTSVHVHDGRYNVCSCGVRLLVICPECRRAIWNMDEFKAHFRGQHGQQDGTQEAPFDATGEAT